MKTLEHQLAEYGQLQDEMFGPIGVDEVTDRTAFVEGPARRHRVSGGRPLAAVLLAMAAVFVVIGITFLGGDKEAPPPAMSEPVAPACSHVVPAAPPTDTSTWKTYVSGRYGLTICHPADWTLLPADHDWALETDAIEPVSTGQEGFIAPDGHVRVSVWSVSLDPETFPESVAGVEAWIERYCEQTADPSCAGFRDRAVPLCNERWDCHPGLLVPFADDIQAFFTGGTFGSNMVVVAVWRGESDSSMARYGGARQLLEAFLSTMDVCPARVDQTPSGCARATP